MVLTLHCHNLSQRIRFVGASFASFFCGHQRCVKYVLFRQFCVALWQNYALESKKYCLTLSNNKEGRNSIGQDFFPKQSGSARLSFNNQESQYLIVLVLADGHTSATLEIPWVPR